MAAALSGGEWDVIISDHSMPQFSAPAALSLLKSRGLDVPFLVVSGSIDEEQAVVAMRQGARDYLMKDKLARLGAAVERELDEAEARRIGREVDEQRREAERMLTRMARLDRLTDLPNRTALEEMLEQAVGDATRANSSLALLHINLRRLIEIEHTLGRSTGDLVLREIVERLRGVLRPPELLARLAGDELALLIPGGSVEAAAAAANRILKALEDPIRAAGLPILVEPIIGIGLLPGHAHDAGALLRAAAVAMRAARSAGAGYSVYDPERDPYDPRSIELLGDLRQAIDANQLYLEYQPCVQLASRRVVSAEALVRWRHPGFGVVRPDQFVPLAERTGLIRPLTRWVLNEALRQQHAWRRAGTPLSVAINLSARNLEDPEILDRIRGLIETWGVSWAAIEFEITESALTRDPRRAIDVLERVSALGASLAIDDFGTGYSSLLSLRKLPFSKIKIDKSFVMGMRTSAEDSAIVRSIIDLGRTLELQTHAEGVEDQETFELLASLGCDFAQGFHMGRPMPEPDFSAWLSGSPFGLRASAQ
jgi:diguanylate cyclase (GGDEF)-like protein